MTTLTRAKVSNWVAPKESGRLRQPLQVRDSLKLYVCFGIDPERVRPHLPPGLEVASSALGVISTFTVPGGPFGPWTCSVLGVTISGHDSPDGMEGVYWTGSYADSNGLKVMRQYDDKASEGVNTLERHSDIVLARAKRVDGSGLVAYTARFPDSTEMIYDGAYNYLGSDAGGARIFSIIGHDRRVVQGELVSLEIAGDAAPGVQALAPITLNWAVYHEHIDYIMGVPRALGVDEAVLNDDASRGLMLAVFDNAKRPSIIIDGTDIVRYRNEAADRLLGQRFEQGRKFIPIGAAERAAYAKVQSDIASGQRVSDAVSFDIGETDAIIAKASALDPRIVGEGAIMMTFLEPTAGQESDVSGVLRLLGLTPAEARLGSFIGRGLPPRVAAEELGLSENTVRSTMKLVYDKLNITRQSELARMVARIELL